jgi:hypothetical protein
MKQYLISKFCAYLFYYYKLLGLQRILIFRFFDEDKRGIKFTRNMEFLNTKMHKWKEESPVDWGYDPIRGQWMIFPGSFRT